MPIEGWTSLVVRLAINSKKVAPILNAQGDIAGVIDSCRDIGDTKRAEAAVMQAKINFR